MPKKRNAENRGLPSRWQLRHGAYYYQVPPGNEKHWDGKKLFRLGSTPAEAHREWASRIEQLDKSRSLAELIDRYSLEHLTTLSPKTKESYLPALARIRTVFGDMDCIDVEAHHANTYFDRIKRKHGLPTARTDIGVLRGLFSQGLRWGAVTAHPMVGLRFEQVAAATDEVHQWQIDAMLSLTSTNRTVVLAQLYIKLKLMTGLRRADLLTLTLSNLKADGIHCTLRKTKRSSGKKMIFAWIDPDTGDDFTEFKNLIESIKQLKPRKRSGFLFTKQDGEGFVDEDTGRADGFDSLWRRFMATIIEHTELDTRVKEKTLRAFVADESKSLEDAAHRLGHTNTATTRKHYRKRADVIRPLVLRNKA